MKNSYSLYKNLKICLLSFLLILVYSKWKLLKNMKTDLRNLKKIIFLEICLNFQYFFNLFNIRNVKTIGNSKKVFSNVSGLRSILSQMIKILVNKYCFIDIWLREMFTHNEKVHMSLAYGETQKNPRRSVQLYVFSK